MWPISNFYVKHITSVEHIFRSYVKLMFARFKKSNSSKIYACHVSIKNFKVDDECYEIYGWQTDEDGKEQKIEVYFDASNGDIVKKKMK